MNITSHFKSGSSKKRDLSDKSNDDEDYVWEVLNKKWNDSDGQINTGSQINGEMHLSKLQ